MSRPGFHVPGGLIRLLALLLPLCGGVRPASAQPVDPCPAPADYAVEDAALPHVADAIAAGQLPVLVLGSGTTVEPVAGRPDGSYPARMAEAIRAARPGLQFDLTVRGGRGATAAEMLETMRTELGSRKYRLVVWQTGTVEAVRNVPPAEFYDTLVDGAALAQDSGADLVLVDPQYSRFLEANADLAPYEDAMRQVAALPAVMLFHRYDLMRNWAGSGGPDLERVGDAARTEATGTLQACLGRFLARAVLDDARTP